MWEAGKCVQVGVKWRKMGGCCRERVGCGMRREMGMEDKKSFLGIVKSKKKKKKESLGCVGWRQGKNGMKMG